MYETMSGDYFWPNMSRDIGDFIAGCLPCQRAKATQPMSHGKSMAVVPERPFSVVGMDVYGPFPITSSETEDDRGYRYVVSIVCHYSRWVKLIPIKGEPTAAVIANVLVYQWIRDFSVPQLLATDKDSVFRAQLTQEVGRLLGIRMHVFPAESQWRAGKVERVHRYLGSRLRVWRRDRVHTWHLYLPFIEMSHHFMIMPQYGMSPYEILYGQRPRLPFMRNEWTGGSYVGAAYGFVQAVHARLRQVQARFNEIESKLIQERLEKINKVRKATNLKKGDTALVFTKGTKDKMVCIWSDLVRVESKIDESTYVVRYPNGEKDSIPTQRLRKFIPAPQREENAVGPFLTDFPHFVNEGKSKGTENPEKEALLPQFTVEQKVPQVGEERLIINHKLTLQYGDHVAYLCQSGDWGVGQFLGGVQSQVLQLRQMDTLHRQSVTRTPREYVWRYHWTARKGKHVLAKQGKSYGAKPSAKNTGGLTPSYVHVNNEDILGTVHLNADGSVENDSWTALMNVVQSTREGLNHLFVRTIWCYD